MSRRKVSDNITRAITKLDGDVELREKEFGEHFATAFAKLTAGQKRYLVGLSAGMPREIKKNTLWIWRNRVPGFKEFEETVMQNPGPVGLKLLEGLKPKSALKMAKSLDSDKWKEVHSASKLIFGFGREKEQGNQTIIVINTPKEWGASQVIEGEVTHEEGT